MSVKAMNWASTQYIGCSTCAAILKALAYRHNGKTGQCDPGQDRLAAEAGCSRPTLKRHLGPHLVRGGFITVHHRPGDGFGRQSDAYTLHFDRHGATVKEVIAARRQRLKLSQCDRQAMAQIEQGNGSTLSHQHEDSNMKKKPTVGVSLNGRHSPTVKKELPPAVNGTLQQASSSRYADGFAAAGPQQELAGVSASAGRKKIAASGEQPASAPELEAPAPLPIALAESQEPRAPVHPAGQKEERPNRPAAIAPPTDRWRPPPRRRSIMPQLLTRAEREELPF